MRGFNIMLLSVVLVLGCSRNYVKFEKVVFNDQTEEFTLESKYTTEFQKNIVEVLRFFKEDYKLEKGMLYINKN